MKNAGIGRQLDVARILLVDDDPRFVSRAADALYVLGDLRTACSGRAALSTTLFWQPHVILIDLLMDDVDGFTFLERLHEIGLEHPPFVLYTTDGRGADTRIRPLPDWKVGTLVRSSSTHQVRSAVAQAIRAIDHGFCARILA
jgi:two-component system, OmpR family, response regulator